MSEPPRILVVDDDPGTVRVLARFLSGIGKVHFTTRGEEALPLARQIRPDIVLLDMEMPDMHGFEVCRALRAASDLANVPILFVSAHDEPEVDAAALDAGGTDFISKPPRIHVVQTRVRNYLRLSGFERAATQSPD